MLSVAGALKYTLLEKGAAQVTNVGHDGASFTSPTATSTVAYSDSGPGWLKTALAREPDAITSVILTSTPKPAGCAS